jgi:hypothetical protein
MGMIAFLLTLSMLCICICNDALVSADEEGYGEEDSSNQQQSQGEEEEEPPTAADMFQLCLFSTCCYAILLGPFVFGPRVKRDIEAFKLKGVRTEATLLSQSIDQVDGFGDTAFYNTILVRFTNATGQRIEKEMHVDEGMFDEIERKNLKTLTIYTMPGHPFSASFGDGSHEEYSLVQKILYSLGGFSFAAAGVYCFVVYFTYFDSIPGFVGLIVMHVVVALLSYFGMERFNHHAKVEDAYVGGSVVFGDDPASMLGVSNTVTSAGQGYNEMS